MAGEKRLIRYEDVYKYAFDGANGGSLEDEDFDAIVNAIESVPAVDAVEVVRCKDCKHGDMCSIREAMACTVPEGFCWRGERKQE